MEEKKETLNIKDALLNITGKKIESDTKLRERKIAARNFAKT